MNRMIESLRYTLDNALGKEGPRTQEFAQDFRELVSGLSSAYRVDQDIYGQEAVLERVNRGGSLNDYGEYLACVKYDQDLAEDVIEDYAATHRGRESWLGEPSLMIGDKAIKLETLSKVTPETKAYHKSEVIAVLAQRAARAEMLVSGGARGINETYASAWGAANQASELIRDAALLTYNWDTDWDNLTPDNAIKMASGRLSKKRLTKALVVGALAFAGCQSVEPPTGVSVEPLPTDTAEVTNAETPVVAMTPTYVVEGEPTGIFAQKIEAIRSIDPYDAKHKEYGADKAAQILRQRAVEDFHLEANTPIRFVEVSGLVNGVEVGGGMMAMFTKKDAAGKERVFIMTTYDQDKQMPGYFGVGDNPGMYSELSLDKASGVITMTPVRVEGSVYVDAVWEIFKTDGKQITGFLPFGQGEWLEGVVPTDTQVQMAPINHAQEVKDLIANGDATFDTYKLAYVDKEGKPVEAGSNELVKSVEGAEKEALNKYFWGEIWYPLNADLLKTNYGVGSLEEFWQLVKDNGGMLPAREGVELVGFGNENFQRRLAIVYRGIQMDKPLKIDLDVKFMSPDDLASDPLPNGLFYPIVDVGYKTTDPNTSVAEGIVLADKGDHRVISLLLAWRLKQYDLDGKKFESIDPIDEQANKYAEELLYFAYLMTHPDEASGLMTKDEQMVWRTYLKEVGNVKYEESLYFNEFRTKLTNKDYNAPQVFQVDN